MEKRKPVASSERLSLDARKALERELWKLLLKPRPVKKEDSNVQTSRQEARS